MSTKFIFTACALMLVTSGAAEEQPAPVQTALSSTTISGYVNVATYWQPGSPPIRFDDLCRALRERGFELRRSGKRYLFYRSGKHVLVLLRQGPFARRADVLAVQRCLQALRLT